jgi:hypothetical protein
MIADREMGRLRAALFFAFTYPDHAINNEAA